MAIKEAIDYMRFMRVNNLNPAYSCLDENPELVKDLDCEEIIDAYVILMKHRNLYKKKGWDAFYLIEHEKNLSFHLNKHAPEKVIEVRKSLNELLEFL